MKKLSKLFTVALVTLLSVSCLTACDSEQAAYPDRDITMVIPFGAGGGTDVWARAIAAGLAEDLGVNVTPNNITGGSAGSTGTQAAWDAAHDGYTLLGTSETPLTIPVTTPIERTAKDYEYFIAAGSPGLVCINAKAAETLGIKTMDDLVAYGEKESINIAGTTGGLWFALSSLLIEESYGNLGFTFVPYDGSAGAIQAAAGGVDAILVTASAGEVAQYLESGDLIALANMAPEAYGDVPSVVDSVPAIASSLPLNQWLGFSVPSDTPQEVLDTLTESFNKVMATDKIKELAESQSAIVFNLTGEKAKEMALASEKSLCNVLYELGQAQYNPADKGIK